MKNTQNIQKTHSPIGIISLLVTSLFFSGCGTSEPENKNLSPEISPEKNISIIAMGDSLTAGYGLENPEKNSYPAQLEKKLQEDEYLVSVENAGISGETTTGGLGRAEWIAESQPEIILLFLGANDMLRGISPSVTRQNLEQIIDIFQEKNISVILLPMQAQSSLGREYQTEFSDIYLNLAEEKNIPLTAFPLQNVALIPNLNTKDGIHPNQKGYKIVVENIYESVEKEIQNK